MTSVATRLTLLSSRPGDDAAQSGAPGGSCSAALAEQPWDFPAPLTEGYAPGRPSTTSFPQVPRRSPPFRSATGTRVPRSWTP